LYNNDLPAVISDISRPTLFADDISLILAIPDYIQLKDNFLAVLGKIIDRFQANLLTLDFKRMHYMYFKMKMSQIDQYPLKYINKQINRTHCIDFLGVSLDSTLSWQGYINKVITKLNSACFAIRSLKLFLTIQDLRIVYFAYVLSIITYCLPFWGNMVNSKNVFMVQKKSI
jgi:hypothetical protein